jgi:hypothetical protein
MPAWALNATAKRGQRRQSPIFDLGKQVLPPYRMPVGELVCLCAVQLCSCGPANVGTTFRIPLLQYPDFASAIDAKW